MKIYNKKPKSCEILLKEFDELHNYKTSKLNLINNTKKDTYNITAPFTIDGKTYLATRFEDRESEISEIVFFLKTDNGFEMLKNSKNLKLQDPFVTFIKNELILGGVEVEVATSDNVFCKKGELIYKTVFYKGKTIFDLEYFTEGPIFMKDIRLLEIDDKILVLTRPNGKIGIIYINTLNELTKENINKAVILEDLFVEGEWGGANEMQILSNGLVGVLSHIACFDRIGDRHYYSTTFAINPKDFSYTEMKLIAKKSMFDSTTYKRKDLIDVIFSGGIIRTSNDKSLLFCGVSDSEAHYIEIKDPFLEYEEETL